MELTVTTLPLGSTISQSLPACTEVLMSFVMSSVRPSSSVSSIEKLIEVGKLKMSAVS